MRSALISAAPKDASYAAIRAVTSIGVISKPFLEPGKMMVRVSACSFAKGDVHLLTGSLSFVFRAKYPYTPGMDICGKVVALGPGVTGFSIGDVVAASQGARCVGGCAEYMLVEERYTARVPEGVSPLVASATTTSAVTASQMVRNVAAVKRGERILVLGGAGGVGSAAVQLAKTIGAFVATTTSQVDFARDILRADVIVNYTTTNWWMDPAFREAPFDCIIDCVGGGQHWQKACTSGVLKGRKAGGRFVAVVADEPNPVVKGPLQLISFVIGMLWRPLWTSFSWSLPRYCLGISVSDSKSVAAALADVASGNITIPLDPAGPFPFTEDGVAGALALCASNHAHGKVVIRLAE